jgi:hypothetical protein
MCQLDSRDGAARNDELHHSLPGRFLLVVPHTGATWRDPTFRCDTGCFGNDQAGTAYREPSKVSHVPIADDTVFVEARVLAHRGYPDAVSHRDGAHGEWFKQGRLTHGNKLSLAL